MKNQPTHLRAAVAAILFAASATANAADAGKLSVTTGFDYSSGNYGTSQDTDTLYIPVTGKYETGPWTFKLTVPYIRVTAPTGGTITAIGPDGRPIRTGTGARTTEDGLGDIVAGVTYNAYDGGANGLLVDLTGKVKFGTADENKGLGTGENDYAAQVDVYKSYGKVTPFGTVGYRVLGDPDGLDLENVWYGSLGVAYQYTPATSSGVVLDFRQASLAGGARQGEATVYVTHKLDKNYKVQGYLVGGFENGSPDWGAGAMLTVGF